MPEDVQIAESSPAPVAPITENSQIEAFNPDQRDKWLTEGFDYKPNTAESEPAKAEEATQAAVTTDSAPAKRETKQKSAETTETRFQELLQQRRATHEENLRLKDELERLKSGVKADPPPAKAEQTTAPADSEDFDEDAWIAANPSASYQDLKKAERKFLKDQARVAVREELEGRDKQAAEAKVAETKRQQLETFQDRLREASGKIADFQETVERFKAREIPLSPDMGEFIKESELGPELLYALGKNFAEVGAEKSDAYRIAQITDPKQAARELARMEVKLGSQAPSKAATPAKKVSSASPPPPTVGGNATVTEDEALAALARGDTGAYMSIMNRRDIARLKGV